MVTTALIFFPKPYVGFNKTQLIKRQLAALDVIGEKLKCVTAYSMGSNFRQFIPRAESIHKFQYGMIRVHIFAVGDEYSNVVLIEGDKISQPLDRYIPFCELLCRITGDEYQVGIVHDPFRQGIAET